MKDITNELFNSFHQISPLSLKDFNALIQKCTFKSYKKGEQILNYGQIENRMTFILSGIVHRTIKTGDEVITINISLSGMYMNNLKSYLEESPSIEVQTAFTDVDIIYMEKEACEQFRQENHTFCYIYSKLRENSYISRNKRSNVLQSKNASKRFELFMHTDENSKRYLKEVPQCIVAEYLNLTPETFSRVKKKYFAKI